MSKYGWERGTLKIPGAEWKRVRDTLVAAFNKNQDELYVLAGAVHARLVAIKAAKGSAAIKANIIQTLAEDPASNGVMRLLDKIEETWGITRSVCKVDEKTKKVTLVVPKKKDFPHAVSSKAESLSYGEFSIGFDHKEKRVVWSVQDNNHSVDRARAHPMGVHFFKTMDSVKWGRQSGGSIVGNDENNRDDREEGGGGNYVTASYGPLGGQAAGVKKKPVSLMGARFGYAFR